MNPNEEFILAAKTGDITVVERLLQAGIDPSASDNSAIRMAVWNGHFAVVERLLQDERVDPSASDNRAVQLAAWNSHIAVVERLLQDTRVDPSALDNQAVRWAVDRLFRTPSVYSTVDLPADLIKHIGMIRSRCTEVCNGLQDLGLPALLTLGILDELIPNEIRMWAKWELVTAVKHFHERQEKKLLI
jgi:hypothetical protein